MNKSRLPKFGKAARRAEKQQAAFAQSLYDLAGQTRPDPNFAARLKSALLARRVATLAQDIRPNLWRQAMFKKLAFAAMALTIVVAAVGLYSWLRGGNNAGELPLLPRLASAAGGGIVIQDGLLSDAEVVLGVDLPDAPASAPVYTVTFTLPVTPEEALAWAGDFGLDDPQVYHDTYGSEDIFVVGSDGRTLTFRADGPEAGIEYRDEIASSLPGDPPSFEQTRDVAVAFLSAHRLLPEHYRVEEEPGLIRMPGARSWMVTIVPEMDGHPLTNELALIRVMVNSAGAVTYAYAPMQGFTQSNAYPIKTAQEAWDELLAGGAFLLKTDSAPSAAVSFRTFQRPAPQHTVGDAVTIVGWVQVLAPEKVGLPLWAQVVTSDGSSYRLSDIPDAAALQRRGNDNVQVSGVLGEALGTKCWRLSVQQWSPATPYASSLLGTFHRDGDAAWVVDDGDASYPLPDAPAELEDGARVEIFVSAEATPGAALDWEAIASPPWVSQGTTTGIESAVTVLAQTDPVPTPEPQYALGERVELTGMVNATLIIESDRQWYETYLQRVPDDFNDYKLVGDDAMMAELAQLHRLHVRVQGQVVTATRDWGGDGPAIVVNSYTQIAPAEKRYRFLGTFTQETVGGRLAPVFTECSSGQRYVVDANPALFPQEYFSAEGDSSLQVEVHGTLPALTTVGGLPQLQIEASMHGSDISKLPCDAPRPIAPGPEVLDRTGRDSQVRRNAFTVDRAELAYYYEYAPLPPLSTVYRLPSTVAQPVWVFSGLSGDGATRFTAYVQAARATYIAK